MLFYVLCFFFVCQRKDRTLQIDDTEKKEESEHWWKCQFQKEELRDFKEVRLLVAYKLFIDVFVIFS